GRLPPALGLLREEDRGFFQDLALLTQDPVLPPQTVELSPPVTTMTGPGAASDARAFHPLPERVAAHAHLVSYLLQRPPALAEQPYRLDLELKRVGRISGSSLHGQSFPSNLAQAGICPPKRGNSTLVVALSRVVDIRDRAWDQLAWGWVEGCSGSSGEGLAGVTEADPTWRRFYAGDLAYQLPGTGVDEERVPPGRGQQPARHLGQYGYEVVAFRRSGPDPLRTGSDGREHPSGRRHQGGVRGFRAPEGLRHGNEWTRELPDQVFLFDEQCRS